MDAKNYSLQPITVYVEGVNSKVCVIGKIDNGDDTFTPVWSQPILTMQNKYSS
jgi:hypothetical protein